MIKITPNIDYVFALELSRSNMADYYTRHELVWDDPCYERLWAGSENFGLYHEDRCVGLVRLNATDEICHLADLQVIPGMQGQGVGSYALDYMRKLAKIRGKQQMRLLVFIDNPVREFYQRCGFRILEQEGVFYQMECTLL
ncbi:GNAT family N-acetyltransferase [Candidatus Thiothrix anitrata]|jgi:GNAT superfamily N-acetyltransferase|uniref:GNAT family N-acetyltransferase n=1 Tax=Candidatus Thiothrix anitrata TaxID=2823902 RepID=A0ABX7X5C7_9GAMM|nr:GNAT family N-acetyltransferase [Candidatus Thiothrix anitrata]QTR51080.1 GNAT family N-acetyltransferase [Candidatus Thiothrix anitrata]